MDVQSDENLVADSCAGDKKAYALLVKRHYKYVFLACMGVLGNVHDAEDAAQEAMLKGFVRIRSLRDGSQFGAWITKIAKNSCINFIRRQKRTQRATEKRAQRAIEEKARQPGQTATRNDELQSAIKKLTKEARLPLVMYYFDGQSVKTVAQKLNISQSGVYLKLRAAIKELHGLLVAQGDIK